MSEPLKLTIMRNEWFRGQGGLESKLVRPEDGQKCCLGFLGNACGYSDEELEGKANPEEVFEVPPSAQAVAIKLNRWPKKLVEVSDRDPLTFEVGLRMTELCTQIILVNDFIIGGYESDYDLTEPVTSDFNREERITQLMAQMGVEVTFE